MNSGHQATAILLEKRPPFRKKGGFRRAKAMIIAMNRNRNNRIEILIFVIVMLSVAVAISGLSFARYTTSGTGNASTARVAKWGFVIDVDADNLFASSGDGTGDADLTSNASGLSVASGAVSVWPNTSGTLLFRVSGTAEVAAEISFVIPDDLEIICLKNGEGEIIYSPILWTLTKNGEAVVTRGDLAAIRDALSSTVIPANVEINDSYVLTWEWPPERGADEAEQAENNGYDTMLAKYKADPQENPLPDGYTAVLGFEFRMTIDVSQTQGSGVTE